MARHSTRPRTAPDRELPDIESLPLDQRERRDGIVDAAVAMLGAVDYADIQVKAVAAEAGVALGTLYRYFGSKDHLMAEALVRWSSGFPAPQAVAATGTVAERLAAVYGRAAAAFERQPRFYGALLHLQTTSDPVAAELYATFTSRQTDTFAAVLPDLSAELRADIVDVMSAVLNQLVRSRHAGTITDADVKRRIERTAELIGRGCA